MNLPDELRTLLERRGALGQELCFRQPYVLQRRTHRWPRSLTHADSLYIRRLDERNVYVLAGAGQVLARNQSRTQPAGATATDDHDPVDAVIHVRGLQRKKSRCRAAALI